MAYFGYKQLLLLFATVIKNLFVSVIVSNHGLLNKSFVLSGAFVVMLLCMHG